MNAKRLKIEEERIIFIDENIDKKCYEINNIENWANCFYNLKSGIILERYRQIISKTENSKFFEALNYEYGINSYPLDTNKAFQIYKLAADTSPDTLSMYRLYRIYKKDYKKFNIKTRNFVFEKFYIMKCYTYLTANERESLLYSRFDIKNELINQLKDENGKVYEYFNQFIRFLYKYHKLYNIKRDDVILIDEVIKKSIIEKRKFYKSKLDNLVNEENPQAIYNLAILKKKDGKLYYEKLLKLNYYRSFSDYANLLDYRQVALNFIKQSLLNGYYSHISSYKEIFFKINEFEEIYNLPHLKSEFMFIIGCMIDAIIADEIEILIKYIYIRKVSIKRFNFGDVFKAYFDIYTKEIINYLMQFMKGKEKINEEQILKYYPNNNFYQKLKIVFSNIYYSGISGFIERNLKQAFNFLNDIIKSDDDYLNKKRFYFYRIYQIKCKERKLNNKDKIKSESNKTDNINKSNNNDEALINLEKKLIKIFYSDFTAEKIKKFPPSLNYILSKLYSSSSLQNEDIIFEYVLLNRASNAAALKFEELEFDYFEEEYTRYKAKKKLEEKNKEENFKKISDAKGIINVEGYGEDGTICPVCFENKKSTICLPCKHFFCGTCTKKIIDRGSLKGKCPICRTAIKITFDINLKKENLVESILSDSYFLID